MNLRAQNLYEPEPTKKIKNMTPKKGTSDPKNSPTFI